MNGMLEFIISHGIHCIIWIHKSVFLNYRRLGISPVGRFGPTDHSLKVVSERAADVVDKEPYSLNTKILLQVLNREILSEGGNFTQDFCVKPDS